jgi:Right handed beta helix region
VVEPIRGGTLGRQDAPVLHVSRHQLGLVVVLAVVAAVLVFLSWPTHGIGSGTGNGGPSPAVSSAAGQAGPARPEEVSSPTAGSRGATAPASPAVGGAKALDTGRWPGASDTGPRAGGTTAPWTGGTSGLNSDSGRTFDRVVVPRPVTGTWIFTGSNVTFRDCSFASSVVFTGDHVRVDHCVVNGGISLSGTAHVDLVGNAVHDWVDGIRVTSDSGNVTDVNITGNWLHNPAPACSDHADGVRLLGVDGLVITHNTIDLGPWIACGSLNNAIQADSTQGPDVNMSITDNLLNGGLHTVRFGACGKTKFEDNHFGPDAQAGLVDAPAYRSCITSWRGNVMDATGKAVNSTS